MWSHQYGMNGIPPEFSSPETFTGPSTNGYFTGPSPFDDLSATQFNNMLPDQDILNQGAFIQSHQFPPTNPPQFSPPPFNLSQAAPGSAPRPVSNNHLQITARAAALKERLIKQREAQKLTASPPANLATRNKQLQASAETSKQPLLSTKADSTNENHDLDLNALISQYSDNTNTEARKDTVVSLVGGAQQEIEDSVKFTKKLSDAPTGSPAVSKQLSNGKPTANDLTSSTENRQTRQGSPSEMSEGEIRDEPDLEPKPTKSGFTEPRKSQEAVPVPRESNSVNKLQLAEDSSRPNRHDIRPDNSPQQPALNRSASSFHDREQREGRDERREDKRSDRRDTPDQRYQKQANQTDTRSERPVYQEADRRPYVWRDSRDEVNRKNETTSERPREAITREVITREAPSLAQLLPHDRDLREWLDITGYHNAPYRDKILNRRRAIALIDIQRAQLVAEMEAEEGRGLPPPPLSMVHQSPAMPPPSMPSKQDPEVAPIPAAIVRESPNPNKRRYSEVQDANKDTIPGKVFRLEERQSGRSREQESQSRRPTSRSGEPSQWYNSRSEDRRSPRSASRERGQSPNYRGYENDRPSAPYRTRSFDGDFYGRDYDDRPYYDRFEQSSSYSGRGRGRGRGRGGYQSNLESSSHKLNNGKPYKFNGGFDKGRRGDTKYFIVKSFNEENVVKCIEDGVWTTQKHNGDVFKNAFRSCMNVILIFSINKSAQFQGYARMESAPGTIETPPWLRSILWESAGAFKVKWLVIHSLHFAKIGHLKNSLNGHQPVLIGKDGQEIEAGCAERLLQLMDDDVDLALRKSKERGSNDVIQTLKGVDRATTDGETKVGQKDVKSLDEEQEHGAQDEVDKDVQMSLTRYVEWEN